MVRKIILFVVMSCFFSLLSLPSYADAVDEKIEKLQAQVEALQRELNQLKKERQTDKEEISSLKSAQEAAGLEAIAPGVDVLVTGYMDLEYSDAEDGSKTFDNHHFNPIIIGNVGDNIFFETEVEYEHAGGEIGLEYAQMHYLFNDYITFGGGKLMVPFGVYNERLHPSWIAKLPTRPLPMNNVVPVGWSEVGGQVRGGIPISNFLHIPKPLDLDYAFYVVNGLQGTEGAGIRSLRGNDRNSNDNLALGGRVGLRLLPWVEVGGSLYHGAYTTDGNQDITIAGADAAFYWDLLTLRGEYARAEQEIDPGSYFTGIGELIKDGYYVEASYYLSAIPLPHINKCELVARYSEENLDNFTLATRTLADGDSHRYSLGLNYYIRDSFIFRVAYDWNEEDKRAETDNDQFTAQLALGF